MQITKCDICKKLIHDNKINLWLQKKGASFYSFEICGHCGQPIVKLLVVKNLFKDEAAGNK